MGKFLGYTIGLTVSGSGMLRPKLVKVEYARRPDGDVTLTAVSGHNLDRLRGVRPVVVSAADFESRPHDSYDQTVEAFWAFGQLGLSVLA